jgi:hypothetical protein
MSPAGQNKRERYLAKHQDQYPFPLDGSDWTRLVSLRIEKARSCRCQHCADLLFKIEDDRSFRARVRDSEDLAKRFWTSKTPGALQQPLKFQQLLCDAEHIDRMLEAEYYWILSVNSDEQTNSICQ